MHCTLSSLIIVAALSVSALAAPSWRREAGFISRHRHRHFSSQHPRDADHFSSVFDSSQIEHNSNYAASTTPEPVIPASYRASIPSRNISNEVYDKPPRTSNPACATLLEIYKGMGGPGWTNQNGWAEAASASSLPEHMDCCEWFGVTCSNDGIKVTSLELPRNRVRGPISDAIYSLPDLHTLNLSSNSLYSNIPPLPMTLHVLDLSHASVYGTLSSSIFESSTLSVVYLTNNTLDGPVDISGAKNLQTLFLDNNYLSQITMGSSHGKKWKTLVFRNNRMHGILPDLSGAVDLEMVAFGNNKFTGQLFDPTPLTKLIYFDLRVHELSGPFPLLSLFNIPSLKLLGLSANAFTGSPVLHSKDPEHHLFEAPETLQTCSITLQSPRMDLGCDHLPSSGASSTWASKCGVIRACQRGYPRRSIQSS